MKKIAIVGAGAVGSNLVINLRNVTGIQLYVFDNHFIEHKDIKSHPYGRFSVGKNKARALEQFMQYMYDVKINICTDVITYDSVNKLLSGMDLIVDCTDYETRRVIKSFVCQENVQSVHGCMSSSGDFGRIIWNEMLNNCRVDEECEDPSSIAMISGYLGMSIQGFLNTGKRTLCQYQVPSSCSSIRI